jgi:small-conductance mechanosensitive channel
MEWKNLYRHLNRLNWLILLLLASASCFVMSPAFTAGIIIGGLMVIVNFHALQHTIRQGFLPNDTRKPGKVSVIAKYYFRLAAMGGVIYLSLSQKWIDPVGLTVGLSIVVMGIVSLGIQMIRKTFSKETV